MKQTFTLELFPKDELQEGQRQLIEVDGVEIAILNIDGEYYGIWNKCPHQGVPMIYGSVGGTQLPSMPHQYNYGRMNEIISCPLHGWEFDLKTGKTLFDPDKVSIKTYEVTEEQEMIVLKLEKQPANYIRKEFACRLHLQV
ncbi:Rieske (2Fe-2S) protein [Brevibacillus reuszeri]|uniref:Rieske (2Fe-2S) protein n=1 Tax=Brevibacillus reuszeri TaxID=54915 RepID=UPI0028A18393|nr:Rieske (2Fe-2S) protein [Brevibacillus reuszeri]